MRIEDREQESQARRRSRPRRGSSATRFADPALWRSCRRPIVAGRSRQLLAGAYSDIGHELSRPRSALHRRWSRLACRGTGRPARLRARYGSAPPGRARRSTARWREALRCPAAPAPRRSGRRRPVSRWSGPGRCRCCSSTAPSAPRTRCPCRRPGLGWTPTTGGCSCSGRREGQPEHCGSMIATPMVLPRRQSPGGARTCSPAAAQRRGAGPGDTSAPHLETDVGPVDDLAVADDDLYAVGICGPRRGRHRVTSTTVMPSSRAMLTSSSITISPVSVSSDRGRLVLRIAPAAAPPLPWRGRRAGPDHRTAPPSGGRPARRGRGGAARRHQRSSVGHLALHPVQQPSGSAMLSATVSSGTSADRTGTRSQMPCAAAGCARCQSGRPFAARSEIHLAAVGREDARQAVEQR